MKPTHQTIGPAKIRGAGFLSPVRLAGDHARDALAWGSNWVLLAVFPRGIYCRNQGGGLVFLGPPSIGAGPLNALCDVPEGWHWQREGFHPRTPVYSDGKALWVDGRFGFSFEGARLWRTAGRLSRWDLRTISERIPLLSREAAQKGPSDGFAPLIPCFPEMVEDPSYGPNPLIRAAWPGIRSLFLWLEGGLAAAPSRDHASRIDAAAVKGLVGLGPGLTPSGDDLLGGVMIALHSLGHKGLAQELGGIVLPHARTCTNTVSLAHLTCAAQGEGAAALHDAILALCVKDDHRLATSLEKIGSIGATSGWDALAGVFLVMKALPARKLA